MVLMSAATPLEAQPTPLVPRLDVKPWGGRELERFGLVLPPGVAVGEALVTAGEATVSDGPAAGRSLGELITAEPGRLGALGQGAVGGRAVFPLLVKLIDAAANLSVQVHPDDIAARPLDRLGKTEAWHVLAAAPGASLYLGLRPGVGVEQLAEASQRADGSSAALLRVVPAQVGTTVLIPAGTVHALGAGVVVYEVQQPSDVTFRLDDWGRVDAEGRSRELHLGQGLAVTRAEMLPELIPAVALRSVAGRRHLLAACRYFALERIALHAGETVPVGAIGSPAVVTLLSGEGRVHSSAGDATITAGRSAVVWPSSGETRLAAKTPLVALRCWVPNLRDEVVAPALAANASQDAVAALGGPLDDVRAAMQGP
jgi:mannose-6-phosphate isomerase